MRRAVTGERERQLQNQVDPCGQGHLGPHPFVDQRRFATLQKMTAHDRNAGVRIGDPQTFLQMMQVAVMKGIVFGDQANNTHIKHPGAFHKGYSF